jgi:hypothetical protein
VAGLGTLPLGAFWLLGFGAFFAGGVLHLSFLMQVENTDVL